MSAAPSPMVESGTSANTAHPRIKAKTGVMNVISDVFVAVVFFSSQYIPTKARAEPTMPR
jgi:hypothetical protein